MTAYSTKDEAQFISASMDVLRRYGVSLTLGNDFDEYRDLLAQGRPDHVLGEPFDPKLHDLGQKNAVWIIGRDADRVIMHTQALRLLDIGTRSLGEFLHKGFRKFPPSGLDIDFRRSRFRVGPGAQTITGKVCYHGEVWMGGFPGQFRGSGLSSILGRFAFLTAIQSWNPDYVFGFMPKPVAYKGFVERQGYMHTEPGSLRWYIKGQDTPIEGFLAYMSAQDMRYVLGMSVSDMVKDPIKKSSEEAA